MNPNLQSGRTLIELLVAMALGLMVIMGVSSLYLASAQNNRFASSVAQAEEQGTTLLHLIGVAIKRAGYSEIVGTTISANQAQANQDNLLYRGPAMRGCTGGRFTDPAGNDFTCTAGGGVGDTLAVWFQGDTVLATAQGPTPNCLGGLPATVAPTGAVGQAALGAGAFPLVNNAYWVQNGTLFCQGFDPGGAEAGPEAIVDGVLDFRVFYGFDEQGYANPAALSDRPAARRIVDAAFLNGLADVGVLSPWDFVVSVHLCLLLRTGEAGIAADPIGPITPCPADAGEAAGTVAQVNNPLPGAVVRAYTQVFTVRSRATPSPMRPV
jgi:type IV pilus assembly protein PilW